MIKRREFNGLLGGLGLSAWVLGGPVQAQALPKTVRILVGFPPGGSADLLARALAQQLVSYGAQVIVDNKPGAGGRIALEQLKNAEADGSVLAVTPASMMVVYPHIYRKLSYQPLQDFAPVGKIGAAQFVFTVGPLVPASVKTLADFVAWAKAQPALATYGSSGAGSIPHFTGVALAKAAHIELTHVAYKGAAPAMSDLLGGQVAANVGVISNALPHIVSGKLRALAVSGPVRSAALPDVPTVGEAGYRAAQAMEWFGVFLPARASGEAVNRLHAAVREALSARPLQDALAKASFDVAAGESVKEFTQQCHTDLNRWGEVVKVSGFTPED
jgi:tripartite-type tricarboxylate transporter receptor subunit TctC